MAESSCSREKCKPFLMGIIAISSPEGTLLSGSPPSSCPPAAELRPLYIFNSFLPKRVPPVNADVSAQQHSSASPRRFQLFYAAVPTQASVVPCCHSLPAGIVPPASSGPASAEADSRCSLRPPAIWTFSTPFFHLNGPRSKITLPGASSPPVVDFPFQSSSPHCRRLRVGGQAHDFCL